MGNEKYQDGSSICVVAKVPEHIACQFPKDADEDADDPHITVLYIGDMPREKTGTLINTCKNIFGQIPFLRARLDSKVSYFDPSDSSEGRRVAKLDVKCPDLHYFHKRLWDELEGAGVDVAHSFPEYHPHVTLDYIEPDTEYEGPVPNGEWDIDGIEIWGWEDHIRIPFISIEIIADNVVARVLANRVVSRVMQAQWSRLKNHFNVRNPLFHATTGPRAMKVIEEGFKSDSGYSDYGMGNVLGVSFSRSLEYLLGGHFGNAIFVVDKDELGSKFKVDHVESYPEEREERVVTKHLPPKYIKGLIFNGKLLKGDFPYFSSLPFPVVHRPKSDWVLIGE